MNKRTMGIIAAIIVGIAGFMWLTKPSENKITTNAKPSTHIEGNGAKNVTLTEYGDFQCPACGAYYPVVKAVVEKYKEDIFFQFSNFPLESLHQNARAGARAAEAADKQGKYWEMHDQLYQNQTSWQTAGDPLSLFTAYAKTIGITDTAKFTADYKSSEVNNIINADLKEGQKLNITATPTFFINGKKIDSPRDQAAFENLIADAIAAKK